MNKKELFQYLKFCLKKRNDERFVKNLYQLGNDYSLVNLQKMGGNQGGIRCFHIAPDASGSGFLQIIIGYCVICIMQITMV